MTSILGYLGFLTEKELPAAIYSKYASICYEKALQIETLIESLFDVAYLSDKSLVISKEQLDLRKLLLQKQEEFFPQLSNADMQLQISISSAFPIQADGELLARVFDNLISNAILYAREGKIIELAAKYKDSDTQITLTTHANPVPINELSNIFNRLYRLDKSRASSTGGKGLGLFISRRIIELHGGTISASQTDDGTEFLISLPNE